MMKKVLSILLVLAFIIVVPVFLGGCNEKAPLDGETDVEFPMDDKGYPQSNIVMINSKSYPVELAGNSHKDSEVDSEIQIKMEKDNDTVEVILPRYLPINYWSIGEKEYMDLISYSRTSFTIKDENMIEGVSAEIQSFKIQVPMDETTEILLKWSNINEEDKLFKDKKEDYLLKIVVSY